MKRVLYTSAIACVSIIFSGMLSAQQASEDTVPFDVVRIQKNSPCEMTEMRIYCKGELVPTGRNSTSGVRTDQVVYAPLFDGDITTRARWEDLTVASIAHAGWKEVGYFFKLTIPAEATHMYIATPDAASLKGSRLDIGSSDLSKPIDTQIPLDGVAAAGEDGIFEIDLLKKTARKVDAFPDPLTPYSSYDVVSTIKGNVVTFDNDAALAQVELPAPKTNGGKGAWKIVDGSLRVVRESHVGRVNAVVKPHMTLKPGQSFAVTIDHGLRVWTSKLETSVLLGKSRFLLDNLKVLIDPSGNRFVATRWTGVGAWSYTLVLSRGTGRDSNRIYWQVHGDGLDCQGDALLLNADADMAELPIAIEYTRDYRWHWFAYAGMEKDKKKISDYLKGKKWPVVLDETDIKALAVGTLSKPLPQLRKANGSGPCNLPMSKMKGWPRSPEEKKTASALPKLVDDPLSGKGVATKDELARIVAWLRAVPAPLSNYNHQVEWQYGPIAVDIRDLIRQTASRELLDILITWCDSFSHYRNGGKNIQMPCLIRGQAYGNIPIFSCYPAGLCIDGKLYSTPGTNPAGAWAIFAMTAELISMHPEWYELPAPREAGKTATYLETAKEYIAFSLESVPYLMAMLRGNTYEFTNPWNQQEQPICGLHYLLTTMENLKKHGHPARIWACDLAEKSVRAFIRAFFSPRNFHIQRLSDKKPAVDIASFFYDTGGVRYEDLGHSNAEARPLFLLYESGRYADIYSEYYANVLRDTIQHGLLVETDGGMSFRKHFAPADPGETPKLSTGRSVGSSWACFFIKADRAFYERLVRCRLNANQQPTDWKRYLSALVARYNFPEK